MSSEGATMSDLAKKEHYVGFVKTHSVLRLLGKLDIEVDSAQFRLFTFTADTQEILNVDTLVDEFCQKHTGE
jgi:hypothetical protein